MEKGSGDATKGDEKKKKNWLESVVSKFHVALYPGSMHFSPTVL